MTALAPSRFDRFLAGIAPNYAVRRYQARLALNLTGQYSGARSDRAALKTWRSFPGSPDADILGDLQTLRSRSRDLARNNPIAVGALATVGSHTIGTGLRMRSVISPELLKISEDEANIWERRAEQLFDLWARSQECDITRTQNFYALQNLVFRSTLESGDCIVLRRRTNQPGALAPLSLMVVEADRLITPKNLVAYSNIRSGVLLDEDGAPQSYFIANHHPGESYTLTEPDYVEIPAFGKLSGERMVLHVFDRQRPDQTRGVPYLAPVIETLKQLDRFTEAEIMKAVVSSFFTVFMRTNTEDGLAGATPNLPNMAANEITMGPGTIVDIGPDEAIQTAQSSVNTAFDPFFQAVVRQIGVALSIPYELLIMHFTASYSASRAAIEMATQFFKQRREWLVHSFCQPVYVWFLSDAISAGVIQAPGFFEDPVAKAAWCGSVWIGPPRMSLDPKREWDAERIAIEIGARTLEEVTIEHTGRDWGANTTQRGREHAARVRAKLEPELLDPNRDLGGVIKPNQDASAPEDDQSNSEDGQSTKNSAPSEKETEPKKSSTDDQRLDSRGKFIR